ncbi:hypothetical protein H2203_006155 [Taxawa tesnikishii (nom. ined.)]|nr:hypothetical protein H2203_006155 [Dothideales sp. JES 119]
MAIEHLLNSVSDSSSSDVAGQKRRYVPDSPESVATVPKLARLLRDSQNRFMYIGDSATLSWLQSVRRLCFAAIGECDFTRDGMRHSILETVPSKPAARTPSSSAYNLTHEEALRLTQQYLLATSGILHSSIFYLVMAIGAQASPRDNNQDDAEEFFLKGRQLAFSSFTEAPSIRTVQSYVLIAMYMLGACRRNGAFMVLGIAVRAAHALGIHRRNTHALFPENERLVRERVWRSVRVLDLFLSGSLGRPPATYDFEREQPERRPSKHSAPDEHFSSAVMALCRINERIIIDVYMKQQVSTELASTISSQYRAWTDDLPPSLNVKMLEEEAESPEKLREILAVAHVLSTYYSSIILLTRPFVILRASLRIKQSGGQGPSNNPELDNPSMSPFADACLDSALRILDLADRLLRYPTLPQRLPFLLNSVFNAALVLGTVIFADFDHSSLAGPGLEQAERFISHFPNDPHACRYAQILGYMTSATSACLTRRREDIIERRSKQVNRLFGHVGQPSHTARHQQDALLNSVLHQDDCGSHSSLPITPAESHALEGLEAFASSATYNGAGEQQAQQYDQHAVYPDPSMATGIPFATFQTQMQETQDLRDFAPFPNILTPFPDDALFYVGEDLHMFGL